nr:MAG TPA: leucine-rich repeat protein [Caudoviricetes sp.]
MKKRLLSLALCLVLVVGLFSGLTVNASAGKIDDLKAWKKKIAEKIIKEKIEQFKEEFEIPDLDTDAILSSFATAATSGDFGENNCLHWEVTSTLTSKTLTITGTGAMPDFDFPNGNLAPWWNYEALGMNAISEIDFDIKGNLKRVIIGDGVTNVGDYALFCLPAATQITLPESVTSIGRYGIALCSKLNGISLPKAVTGIGDFGLAGNNFTSISLPDGLQTLGRGAFDACASLSGMTLPAAITAVPDKCFNDCTKLLTVDYKGEVTAIGERAFEGCKSLTKAPIPAAVTALGNSAFNGCIALTDVTLPAGVTAVPDACFQGCTALADMKLPGTVTSVGHNAFTGCKALKDVRCYGAPPTVQPGGAAEHSFEPGIVTIHYNPDPVYGWTLDTDGTWQGYKVSSKGACLHTGYGTTKNTVPATCGADGRIDTICANCGDVIATEVIPATGAHTWDNGTVTTEPTETTPGVRTFTCAVCSQTKTEVIPATGAHTFVFTKNVAPSCTEAGYDLYTCRDCGASEQRNVKPALGHKWDSGTVTTEPTETDPGTMTYTCTVCGATKTEVIPATGPHTHVWDEGTVTVAPTETTPGVRTYTCTVCGQTRTEIIPATGSAVCPGGAACPSFRFRDVPAPSNWAHEGIDYCVRHGLMSGFDATTFSPDTVSTRAQIVMILYNLSGDTTDYSKYYVPFTDVRPSTWYYNAVAWGYDKDIVAGMSTTTFAPDGLITREQMAVLLYGYTEKYAPAYLGGAASLNGFPDAASVSNWAYAAMSWAVGNGLISGIASNGADYLAPSGGATRAQIAAIMMRYCRLTGL